MVSRVFLIWAAILAIELLVLRPRRMRKGARKTIDLMKKMYCGAHEYREVNPVEFPQLDHEFYRQTQAELEKAGFRYLADIEDVTVARANPNFYTFLRSMIGDDGTIMASIYDARVRGLMRLLQFSGLLPHDMRIIDLETEFDDGSFVTLSTATLAGRMNHPPQIKNHYLPTGTPVPQLLDEHRRLIADYMQEHPELQPRRHATHEEVREAQNRMNEIKSQYRAGIGYMAPGELEQIASPGQKTTASELAKEVEKLQVKG